MQDVAPREDGFASWRRAQGGRRRLYWLVRLAVVLPSLLTLGVGAPLWAAAAMQIAVVLALRWIRFERRKQLKAIVAWSADKQAEPGL